MILGPDNSMNNTRKARSYIMHYVPTEVVLAIILPMNFCVTNLSHVQVVEKILEWCFAIML